MSAMHLVKGETESELERILRENRERQDILARLEDRVKALREFVKRSKERL